MNSHLNIYKPYTKKEREGFQLEDDLTRSLAVTLQENDLFSHHFIKQILEHKKRVYENLFDDYSSKKPIVIDIQKRVEAIEAFNHLYAVRISGDAMGKNNFFSQNNDIDYNPITDMFIQINDVVIIFEVKPNDYDSTAQLYNQALNTVKNHDELTIKKDVTPVDFNWKLIMQLAVRINNYQEAIAKPSRILDNFISYIKTHNYSWLPQLSLSALSFEGNTNSIQKRFNDAIEKSNNKKANDRLGIKHDLHWAEEILINFDYENKALIFNVYPGNTKAQGWHIFKNEGEPNFKKKVFFLNKKREVNKAYHIKFSSFQSYFTGMWANEEDLIEILYTKENFEHFSGRKKRDKDWADIEKLFNTKFNSAYNWKEKCDWEKKVINTNRNQFDLSFGYEISFKIPYKEIQGIDITKNDLEPLIRFIEDLKLTFTNIL